jgi:hypothetical protein
MPIRTVIISAEGAWAFDAGFLSSPQPARPIKTAVATMLKWERNMANLRIDTRRKKSADYADGPMDCQFDSARICPAGTKAGDRQQKKPAAPAFPGRVSTT